MSKDFQYWVEVCHCGHDKDSHFFDHNGPGDCLGMRCDCRQYVHRDDPLPKRVKAIKPPVPDSDSPPSSRIPTDPLPSYYGPPAPYFWTFPLKDDNDGKLVFQTLPQRVPLSCTRCNQVNEYAEPNQANGTYVCFECR